MARQTEIRAKLEQCRRVVREIGDARTKAILEAWAEELEQQLGPADPLYGERQVQLPEL